MMAFAKIQMAAVVLACLVMVPAGVVLALESSTNPGPASMPAGDAAALVAQGGDAADLYGQAFRAITVDSPAATAVMYPVYSPGSAERLKVEAAAWDADVHVRELAHQARFTQTANWPITPTKETNAYYNGLRNLANHLGDSAVYAYTRGNSAEAVEIIGDLKHLGDLFEGSRAVGLLTGIGINTLAMYRLEIITSGITLTDNPQDTRDLQVATANELIAQLLHQPQPDELMLKALGPPASPERRGLDARRIQRITEQLKLVAAEENFAAMSLACHVFKFENGRWPSSLEELIPTYLCSVMVDPWGDGTQTLGYVLIKVGLPDGSDRPMVFSRYKSTDGLFYAANRMLFELYFGDGTDRSQKQGGQFRDVSNWVPAANYSGPTTRPLPAQLAPKAGAKVLRPFMPIDNPNLD